jgi:hypothetical protein
METSNESTGETLFDLMSYVEDTPANPSAPPVTDEAKTTRATCGRGYWTPLAIYDLATQSWRTSEDISLWAEMLSSETLPPSGMTQNGTLYEQPLSAHLIAETGCLLWPTPRAAQGETRNHTVWLRSSDKPQNLENRVAALEPSAIGGKLNPTWVEWLMGFPIGWTDLED